MDTHRGLPVGSASVSPCLTRTSRGVGQLAKRPCWSVHVLPRVQIDRAAHLPPIEKCTTLLACDAKTNRSRARSSYYVYYSTRHGDLHSTGLPSSSCGCAHMHRYHLAYMCSAATSRFLAMTRPLTFPTTTNQFINHTNHSTTSIKSVHPHPPNTTAGFAHGRRG